MASKPNLTAASCLTLTATTEFPLGRKRLAEDTGLRPGQLLKHAVTFREQYPDEGEHLSELTATLALGERSDQGQDRWSLELTAGEPTRSARPPDGPRKPTQVLKHLGKMGIECNFHIVALFAVPSGTALRAPKVPIERPYVGGAFSHLIEYTLAKVQNLEVLYEVSVRWLSGRIGVAVGFTYRRTLNESIYSAALERARELFGLTVASKAEEAPKAEPPTKAEPEPPTKAESASTDTSDGQESQG